MLLESEETVFKMNKFQSKDPKNIKIVNQNKQMLMSRRNSFAAEGGDHERKMQEQYRK